MEHEALKLRLSLEIRPHSSYACFYYAGLQIPFNDDIASFHLPLNKVNLNRLPDSSLQERQVVKS